MSVWLINGSVPRKANSFNTPAQAPSSLEILLQKHLTFLGRVDGMVFSWGPLSRTEGKMSKIVLVKGNLKFLPYPV